MQVKWIEIFMHFSVTKYSAIYEPVSQWFHGEAFLPFTGGHYSIHQDIP